MTVASPRAEQRQRTREAILAAAWDVAHESGIGELSLREIARRVGMRAPSLYTHFESKGAILDAMFIQGYADLDRRLADLDTAGESAAVLVRAMETWVAFCLEDLARYQLLYTRVLPGWEPSTEAYAVAVASYDRMRAHMADVGITAQEDLDLWTALATGLVAQQVANEPTTRRWVDLLPRAVRMFLADIDTTGDER